MIDLFESKTDYIVDGNASSVKITHKNHGDFNITVKKSNKGYKVEFYNSTNDYVTTGHIAIDDATIEIMYIVDAIDNDRDIDDEIKELLNWK